MLAGLSFALLMTAVAGTPCGDLQTVSISHGMIESATLVPAGPFVPPGGRGGFGARGGPQAPLPEYCRVRMVLKPSSESNINVELWLPTRNWNGKFLAVGNGGFAGAIQGYGDMQAALRNGYATAGTDTGHTTADGPGAMFGLGHPEKIVDFAYRAVHEMTVKSKQIIDAFYDGALRYSYFKGCSTGGRQAVMAAQRYPEDFDGIIGGALANRHIHMHTASVARSVALARRPELTLPAEKARLVNDAVMQKCDVLKEGFLNNPRQCSFDFSTLLCKEGDAANCLTPGQLETVQTFYAGVKNSKGETIFSGQALGNPIPALQPPTGNPGYGYDTVSVCGLPGPEPRLAHLRPRSRHAGH